MTKYDIIIVGAGASGLIAAGKAAESGAKVLLLEKMNRPGKKLLITGNGRCNITHDAGMAEYFNHIYPNSRFLKNAFSQFFTTDIIQLLAKSGVETIVEKDGRIFPAGNRSADVLNALMKWLEKNNVQIEYNCRVDKLLVNNGIIGGVGYLQEESVKEIFADKVILCTGGNSYPATGSTGDGYRLAGFAGHTIVPIHPALVSLVTEGNLAEKLQGLSLKDINVVIWVNGKKQKTAFGEMIFTHYGLSGPVILNLSRFVVNDLNKNNLVEISIDLKPEIDEHKLDQQLLKNLNESGKKQIKNVFATWFTARLIAVIIDITGLDASKECHQVNAKERRKILNLMKDFRFKIKGYRSFKEAMITAGGINTTEIDSKTMESKIVKNLYFAGEIIDADADTGGYNLQIAWSTGWLAGHSCTKKF